MDKNFTQIKIATLNFNGEIFWSINIRPRLPEDLFNIKRIKNIMLGKIKNGLKYLLSENDFDIIAVQEMLYSPKETRDEIKAYIETMGYDFIYPNKLSPCTHFSVGFIVKKRNKISNLIIKTDDDISNDDISKNKKMLITFKVGKNNYKVLNVHLTKHSDKTNQSLVKFLEGKNDTSIRILLGDFNAYNKNQIEGSNKLCENAELINNLISKDCRTEFGEQENKNYTFFVNGIWKKLDHIFISKPSNIDIIKIEEKVENSVNFYSDKNGFTDHSMLTILV